ncbi:MAG TPA: hypothetical protein ENI86_06855 [Acidimicrobiales bacterium]|nr:hypothetical protein [Acidimicrobiales bacterium]
MKPCLRCKILGDLTIVLGSRWRLLFSLLATAALPVLILAQIYIPDSSGASSIELSAKLIAGAVLGTVLWARVASTVAIMGPSRLRFGPYFAHKIQPPEIGRLQARDVRDCDTGKLQGWHIFATLKRRTTGKGAEADPALLLVLACPDPAEHVVSVLEELATKLGCEFDRPAGTGAPDVLRAIRELEAAGDPQIPSTTGESPVLLRRDLTGELFGNPHSLPLLVTCVGIVTWCAIEFSVPKLLLALLVSGVWVRQARFAVKLTDEGLMAGSLRRPLHWTRGDVVMATEGRVSWMAATVGGIEIFLRNGERVDLPGSALLSYRRATAWIDAINWWAGYRAENISEPDSIVNRFLTGPTDDRTGEQGSTRRCPARRRYHVSDARVFLVFTAESGSSLIGLRGRLPRYGVETGTSSGSLTIPLACVGLVCWYLRRSLWGWDDSGQCGDDVDRGGSRRGVRRGAPPVSTGGRRSASAA